MVGLYLWDERGVDVLRRKFEGEGMKFEEGKEEML